MTWKIDHVQSVLWCVFDDNLVFELYWHVYTYCDLADAAPGSPPQNVRARPVSSNTVVVQWDEPKLSNGVIRVNTSQFVQRPVNQRSCHSPHLVSCKLNALRLIAATVNWVVRCEVTQIAVMAAINRIALCSDFTRNEVGYSAEMRSDEVRWDGWYERSYYTIITIIILRRWVQGRHRWSGLWSPGRFCQTAS